MHATSWFVIFTFNFFFSFLFFPLCLVEKRGCPGQQEVAEAGRHVTAQCVWSLLHPLRNFRASFPALCFGVAWINARCPPKSLCHCHSSAGQGRGNVTERLVGRDKDRERSLTSYHHGQNRLNLGRKGSLICHQSNQSRIMRNKTKS